MRWLRRPTNGVAIAFVHGLLSSGAVSWRHANGCYWPSLVADAVPEAGVYVFSYRTDAFSGTYRLGDAVDALKEHMRLDGLLGCRTIVFVAHSMGGLLVRKLIVERQADFRRGDISIGLFLVASPSLGSRYANLAETLARAVGHTQVDALRFSQSNAWLLDLDKEFQNLKEAGDLRLVGKEIVEDTFVTLRSLLRRQVVEPFSGARYFGEAFKVPGSDHFTIAAPDSPEAIQHRLLLRFVHDMPARAEPPSGDIPQPWGVAHQAVSATPSTALDLDELLQKRVQENVLSLRLDRRAMDHIPLIQAYTEGCLDEIGVLQRLRTPAAWVVGELIQNVFDHTNEDKAAQTFELKLDRTRGGLLISILQDHWTPFDLTTVLRRANQGSFMQMMHNRGLVWHKRIVEGRQELGLELPFDLDLRAQWASSAELRLPHAEPSARIVLAVTPFGRVDETTWQAFEVWLLDAVRVARTERAVLIVDLNPLDYMSSRGLRALTLAKREGAPIVLAAAGPRMAEILAISRYDKLFNVYPDVEGLLQAMGGSLVRTLA